MDCAPTPQVAINCYNYRLLCSNSSVYIDNLYIGDHKNHRMRKVTASTSIISTIAGTGTTGYSGDNGPATSAKLNYPVGVAADTSGKTDSFIPPKS